MANVLNCLTQPKGPHLVDRTSTLASLTALAILVTPEALYDPDPPRVGLDLVYKAPYIQAASFSEAYFFLKLASRAEVSNWTTSALIITHYLFYQLKSKLYRYRNGFRHKACFLYLLCQLEIQIIVCLIF